ncbi:unnamed protein product, partial [Caenorhabditis brenneri]
KKPSQQDTPEKELLPPPATMDQKRKPMRWNETTSTCTNCGEKKKYEATILEKDECSSFIEERIKNKKYCCRILSASKKTGTRFDVPILSELPPVPYLEKIIGVFCNIDGFDILTFIMIVHEYTGVLSKKNNTVHIHFLDSIRLDEMNLEEPLKKRTKRVPEKEKQASVNQVVFQAYCSYAASVGFEAIHFHAMPPRQDVDYVFHRHPPSQRYLTLDKLHNWYSTGIEDCKEVVRVENEGLSWEESDRLIDVLDRHCYEHGFYPSEMKKKLKNIAVVDEAGTLEDLKKHFKEHKESLFLLKTMKPAEMKQAKDALFRSSFVTEDFLNNQRLYKLKFDCFKSANLATQTILHILVLERNECPIQVELTQKENKIVAPRVLLPGNLQIVPPAQDPNTISSAKNEDGPQASHPELRVEGTSSNEEHGDDVMEIDVEEEKTGEAASIATAPTPKVAVNGTVEIPNAAPVDVAADVLGHVDEQAPAIELERVARQRIVMDPYNMAALLAALPDVAQDDRNLLPALHQYKLRPRPIAPTSQMAMRQFVAKVASRNGKKKASTKKSGAPVAQARRARRPRQTQAQIRAELEIERLEAQSKTEDQRIKRAKRAKELADKRKKREAQLQKEKQSRERAVRAKNLAAKREAAQALLDAKKNKKN